MGPHPIVPNSRAESVLNWFERNPQAYKWLRPLIKDVLGLHGAIRRDSQYIWNESGGKLGRRSFPELLRRYQCSYPGAAVYAPRRYRDGLDARIARITARHGFSDDRTSSSKPGVPHDRSSDRQLALPL